MKKLGRPLKKLPDTTIMQQIIRLRGRNNRLWAIVWKHGYLSRRGLKAWRSIHRNDQQVSKWMSRI